MDLPEDPTFTYARIPGGFVPIPEHIRPFLDTSHQPTEGGFVPDRRDDGRDDADSAAEYYYKLRRLSPVRHPVTNRVLSAYSGVELKPDFRFYGHQFDEYIFHAVRSARLFMFRVEKQAALTGHRYPRGLQSTKCRFARCPINGTIRPGQYRVCISEFLDPRNEILDPYHNAGYVHLYCLEEFCNLPSLLVETNITFLPAEQLAKEPLFPPALNAAEQQACIEWASAARQSWKDFKLAYPSAEARPRYKPLPQNRLHNRLEQIRQSHKATNKRRHKDYNGPQVYTYRQPNQAPEPDTKRLRTVPPSILIPALSPSNGPQIYQGAAGLPSHRQPATSHTQGQKTGNVPIIGPPPSSPGQILSSLAVGEAQAQPHTIDAGAPNLDVDYLFEDDESWLEEDLANLLESSLEDLPWHELAASPAAGPQEGVTPEEGTQPEQALQPAEGGQPVATVGSPVVTDARRKSAPPVLGARVRKSSAAMRRSSKKRDAAVAEFGLEELHKAR